MEKKGVKRKKWKIGCLIIIGCLFLLYFGAYWSCTNWGALTESKAKRLLAEEYGYIACEFREENEELLNCLLDMGYPERHYYNLDKPRYSGPYRHYGRESRSSEKQQLYMSASVAKIDYFSIELEKRNFNDRHFPANLHYRLEPISGLECFDLYQGDACLQGIMRSSEGVWHAYCHYSPFSFGPAGGGPSQWRIMMDNNRKFTIHSTDNNNR